LDFVLALECWRGQVQVHDQIQVQVQVQVARSTPTKLDSSVKSLAPRGDQRATAPPTVAPVRTRFRLQARLRGAGLKLGSSWI
jgi:hypothetical protein